MSGEVENKLSAKGNIVMLITALLLALVAYFGVNRYGTIVIEPPAPVTSAP